MTESLLFSLAHVKWFTTLTESRPAPLATVLSPVFLAGAVLTLVVAVLLTYLNLPLQNMEIVKRIHAFLDRLQPWSPWILRIGMVAPLIGGALGGYLLHYELGPIPLWLQIAQGVIAVALVIPRVDRYAAIGVIGLYSIGVSIFGLHHMLDYLFWVGVAYFLAVRGSRIAGVGIPVLYITTGLALSWAAIEKWVFPDLALDILTNHPIPTFGFPAVAFLILSGWIELGVGYLMITGVLNRFLSLVVTVLFILTSSVFGVHEILGHWLVHAALVVFLIEGTGKYVTPVLWHRTGRLQLAFVGVTLIPFVAGLIGLYYVL